METEKIGNDTLEIPIEDNIREEVRLNEEGKIRYLGLSEAGPTFIRATAAVCIRWSSCKWKIRSLLGTRRRNTGPFRKPWHGYHGLRLFGKGHGSSTFSDSGAVLSDYQTKSKRFEARNLNKKLALAKSLRDMVTAQGVAAAQIAIAWSLAKGVPVVLLPGAKCVVHLEDNPGALAIDLMDGEVTQLDAAFSPSAASDRLYPTALPAARQQ